MVCSFLGFLFSVFSVLRSGLFLVFFSRRVTSTDLVYSLFWLMVVFFSFSVLGFWPFNAKLSFVCVRFFLFTPSPWPG